MTNIFSIGSLNMDIVLQVTQLPGPGETVHSHSRKHFPGGKGANQAVAAARCGVSIGMIGAVGRDMHGDTLLASLQEDGIDTEHVVRMDANSGTAFITVDANAENHIVLDAGANGLLTPEHIPDRIAESGLILLQNEIPWSVNQYVLEMATKRGVPVLLNAAPAMRLEPAVLPLIGILAANEIELATISGQAVNDSTDVLTAAGSIIDRGIKHILVTLGSEGSVWLSAGSEPMWMPAFQVQPVDTTAAGDTFIGAFAVEYASGARVSDALRFASAAAAIAVTREGAQSSIPTREEVLQFMK